VIEVDRNIEKHEHKLEDCSQLVTHEDLDPPCHHRARLHRYRDRIWTPNSRLVLINQVIPRIATDTLTTYS